MKHQYPSASEISQARLATSPRFYIGQCIMTGAVGQILSIEEIEYFMHRYVRGDWGESTKKDCELNELAIQTGDVIVATYNTPKDQQICIRTEIVEDPENHNRLTTVSLPEECWAIE